MTVLSLDWNATRVRAVLGRAGDYALPVPLEPPWVELAAALDLAASPAEVGAAALRHCRAAPHLIGHTFLPHLSDIQGTGPHWPSGRARISALDACGLIWKKLSHLATHSEGIVLTLPSYLHTPQADALRRLGENLRFPVLGSAPALLTAALAGHGEQFWQRSVLVIDADDHAMTLGWVRSLTDQAHLVESKILPHLSLRVWRERLLDALSELFVWQHRRDPRDVPMAEQSLFEQLEILIDSAGKHQAIQLAVQSRQWVKYLLVHPEQTVQCCQPLAARAAREAETMLLAWPASELPRCILLTHAAGRLPGLVDALQGLAGASPVAETKLPCGPTGYVEEDFGANLLLPENDEPGGVLVLSAEAPARAAHALAELFHVQVVPAGHVETIVPLTPAPPADAGPARLHFQGRDFFLDYGRFLIGTQFGAQLHFERSEHPEVAARHCEIAGEPRGFTLYNRCRDGTLLNDVFIAEPAPLRAGDRIRLGSRGPVLRFLGAHVSRPTHALYA